MLNNLFYENSEKFVRLLKNFTIGKCPIQYTKLDASVGGIKENTKSLVYIKNLFHNLSLTLSGDIPKIILNRLERKRKKIIYADISARFRATVGSLTFSSNSPMMLFDLLTTLTKTSSNATGLYLIDFRHEKKYIVLIFYSTSALKKLKFKLRITPLKKLEMLNIFLSNNEISTVEDK